MSSFRDLELKPALPQGLADTAEFARLDQALRALSALDRADPAYGAEVARVEALILEQYVCLPLAWELTEYAVKPWVRALDTNPTRGLALMDAWIASH